MDVWVDAVSPAAAYGALLRALCVVYCISFTSHFIQAPTTIGPNGVYPVSVLHRDAAVKLPLFTRMWQLSSLFMVNQSLAFIRAVLALGVVCAVAVVAGAPAPYSWYCLAFCYAVVHSIHAGFPWDTLIAEMGFLSLFLPAPQPLSHSVALVGLPSPVLAFALRLLAFRLMFGFGKVKFSGCRMLGQDSLYNKYFFITQPIPSKLAWWGYHLFPTLLHRGSLLFLFFAEIITPPMMFIPGWPRFVAAVATVKLMLLIQGGGNFGYFNVLTIALSLCLFDARSCLLTDWSWASALSTARMDGLLFTVFFFGYAVWAFLPFFATNSWVTHGLPYWEVLLKQAAPLQYLAALLRTLHPFRVFNGYGVFPPTTLSPARYAIAFEGSNDGRSWRRWHYRYLPCSEHSKPVIVAPHHPRLDHLSYYEGPGSFPMHAMDFFSGPVASRQTASARVMAGLLRGYDCGFANNPFPDAPPRWVRVALVRLEPTDMSTAWRTGQYYREAAAGLHWAPKSLETLPLVDTPGIPWAEATAPVGIQHRRMGLRFSTVDAAAYECGWRFVRMVREAAGAPGDVRTALSFDDAQRVFTWERLPEVVLALRTQLPVEDFITAQRAVRVMAMALTCMLERVYMRPPPSAAQLQAEVDASGGDAAAAPPGAAQWPDWQQTYVQALPELMRQDPQPGNMPGALGTVDNMYLHAMAVVLYGGQAVFERAVGGRDVIVGRVGLTAGTLPAKPPAALFRDTNWAQFNVSHVQQAAPETVVAVQAFLLAAVNYDGVAQEASKVHLLQAKCLFPEDGTGDVPAALKNGQGGPTPGWLRAREHIPLLPAFDEVTGKFVPHLARPLRRWQVDKYGHVTPLERSKTD